MAANYIDLESGFKKEVDKYFEESRQDLLSYYKEQKANLESNYNTQLAALNDLYSPLQKSYESQIGAYKSQANYDISQAYANYKKQQLNLLQSQRLGTGLKEQVNTALKSNYNTLFTGIKTQEAQNLADLEQAYLKKVISNAEQISDLQSSYQKQLESGEKTYQSNLSEINKASTEYATNQFNLFKNLINFINETSDEEVTLDWMEKQGYLSSNLVDNAEEWELTDYGKDFLAQGLFKTNENNEKFVDYLIRQSEEASTEKERNAAKELYQFYQARDEETGALTNQTTFKDLLGLWEETDGEKVYDTGYDEEQGLNRRLTNENYYKEYYTNKYSDYIKQNAAKNPYKSLDMPTQTEIVDNVYAAKDAYEKMAEALGLSKEEISNEFDKAFKKVQNYIDDNARHDYGNDVWKNIGTAFTNAGKNLGVKNQNINISKIYGDALKTLNTKLKELATEQKIKEFRK